jgi:hypothetical protein
LLRNLLKNLDSDERIQANPRKSNHHNRGSQSKKAGSQENPNPIERRGAGATEVAVFIQSQSALVFDIPALRA